MLNLINIKKIAISASLLALVAGAVLVPHTISAQTAPSFRTGDMMTAANNTTGTDWSDPVAADPGQVVEFRMVVQNMTSGTTATNVVVTANLPTNVSPTSQLVASTTANSDNGASVTDSATVNVNGQSTGFEYVPGHARICNASGCSTAPDTVTTSGLSVGNLGYGESVQVAYKAWVLYAGSTSTPTPTPTPTVAPTPTPSAPPVGGTQNTNNNANANANSNTNEQAQAQSQTATGGSATAIGVGTGGNASNTNTITVNANPTNNVTVNVPTSTPTPTPSASTTTTTTTTSTQPKVVAQSVTSVKELPKTGLPLLALPFLGLIPGGMKFRKFGKSEDNGELENSPLNLWEKRQQSLNS
jgi:hypothetical protein